MCKKTRHSDYSCLSAQAKGRVERKHAVFQDRFVKDLRLYKIKTIDAANIYLEKFLRRTNDKFAKPISSVADIHRDTKPYGDLNQIICWQYRRQLRNDWTIQFKREYFQIKKRHEKVFNPGEFVLLKRY